MRTGEQNLRKLGLLVSNLHIMANIARLCDKRYNDVTGSPYHDPTNFFPPYDEKKKVMIAANVQSIFAVIGELQSQAIQQGHMTADAIGKYLTTALDNIVDSPDYRYQFTPEQLEQLPLNVTTAYLIMGPANVKFMIAANSVWNGYQYARPDKGGVLGAHGRCNIFTEQSLKVLMLDWDQVVVIARSLRELLEGDNLEIITQTVAKAVATGEYGALIDDGRSKG